MRLSLAEGLIGLVICGIVAMLADDAIAVVSIAVLLIGLKLTSTEDGLFVLAAAFTFHWVETSIGLFYKSIFGREVAAIYLSDYRPMVLIALGCTLAIAVGLRLGMMLVKPADDLDQRPPYAMSFGFLVLLYIFATAFEGSLAAAAFEYPSLRQIIVTADTARLGILFLLLRRLLVPNHRWAIIIGVLAFEVALGITGFFAGFREPLVLGALALLEIFDRRSVRHWFAMIVAGLGAVAFGILWMGIRSDYRRNFVEIDTFEGSRSARLDNIESLSKDFFKSDSTVLLSTTDLFVDRMWPIYYPALARTRVPSQVPHTHGTILGEALTHIVTPRVFYPGKPDLESDSQKVRRYSGVMVAGAERNTSIAFGYAAESYVDFGVPLMYVPVFAFGLVIGCVYAWFRNTIKHQELFLAYSTVTFWISLYLFERSWATMLGIALGMFIYLGVPVVLLDRFLMIRTKKQESVAVG